MLKTFQVLTALFALAGTLVQAYQSAKQIRNVDPSGHKSFVAIDDLANEFSMSRHPLQWARRRREVRLLKQESPAEAREHSRIWWHLMSWVLAGRRQCRRARRRSARVSPVLLPAARWAANPLIPGSLERGIRRWEHNRGVVVSSIWVPSRPPANRRRRGALATGSSSLLTARTIDNLEIVDRPADVARPVEWSR